MIAIVLIITSYIGIGILIYSAARELDMPRSEQIIYSVAWPWLFMATLGHFLWYTIRSGG